MYFRYHDWHGQRNLLLLTHYSFSIALRLLLFDVSFVFRRFWKISFSVIATIFLEEVQNQPAKLLQLIVPVL